MLIRFYVKSIYIDLYSFRETTSRFKPTGSMSDLSRSVIDLAISTIKKTHHGVTIAAVSERLHSEKEVLTAHDTNDDMHDFFLPLS